MNKDKLIDHLSQVSGHPRTTCKDCLDALVEVISNALKKDDQVMISGFGTFSATKRAARTGINPATKEKMKIPARRVPKFKAGKGLKDILN